MNDINNNVATLVGKRRVNFYFAKPKGKTPNEPTAESNDKSRPQLKSVLTLKETLNYTNIKMTNQKDKNNKRKYAEIEAESETGKNTAAQILTSNDSNENITESSAKSTQYHVKLDKNFDVRVNALVAELDSKSPILMRNSFLCEEPITWQRYPPFSKISPKRSLLISSANFLQFDEPATEANN